MKVLIRDYHHGLNLVELFAQFNPKVDGQIGFVEIDRSQLCDLIDVCPGAKAIVTKVDPPAMEVLDCEYTLTVTKFSSFVQR
jgi:hypothetical protein